MARMSHNPLIKIGAPLAGLSVAIFVHSLHNSLLTFLKGAIGLGVAVLVAWTGWIIMFFFIVYLIYREKIWLVQYLREEVELNTITHEQYQIVCSMFGQSQARFAALINGRYRTTTRFYQLCGELSHKKRQLATMGDETGNTRWIENLRAELNQISPTL